MLSLGKDVGIFTNLKHQELERDVNYPIRLTIQFYQVSDTHVIPPSVFSFMANEIFMVYSNAKQRGSHVTDAVSKRGTETYLSPAKKHLF